MPGSVATPRIAVLLPGSVELTDRMRVPSWSMMRGTSQLVSTGFIAAQGSFQCVLDNSDDALDMNNSSGPYFGVLEPGNEVDIALNTAWDSTDYQAFNGYVLDWPQSYPYLGYDQVVNFQANDGSIRLAQAQLITARPPERSGARITADLAEIGYPGGTIIGLGNAIVGRRARGTSAASSSVSDAVMSEWGEQYYDKSGNFVFRSRDDVASDPRSLTPQAAYTNIAENSVDRGSTGFLMADAQLQTLPIINDVQLTWNDRGAKVYASDATSQSFPRGKRSWTGTLPLSMRPQAQQYANWLVQRYKNPIQTFYLLTFHVSDAQAALGYYAELLTRELGDMVSVEYQPRGGGDDIVKDCWVRGISHSSVNASQWTTKMWVQDASWIQGLAHYDVSVYDGPDVYAF